AIVRRNGSARVFTNVEAVVRRENHRQRGVNDAFTDLRTIGVKRDLAALAKATAGVCEFNAYLVTARRNRTSALYEELFEAAPVIAVLQLAIPRVKTPPADVSALGNDDSLRSLLRNHDF